ncbi:hypothetical protein HanIR_Chr16g0823571 [Helianthus annuus]|nr:hypothetical protein HanIR_Chr16g0823571 [Helianthus annuus]
MKTRCCSCLNPDQLSQMNLQSTEGGLNLWTSFSFRNWNTTFIVHFNILLTTRTVHSSDLLLFKILSL